MIRFKGSRHFRQRVLLANLSRRPIRIDEIRAKDESPGLRDFEANLLRLFEKLCNGVIVEINETGTSMRYKPGHITGGGGLEHDCSLSRGIGYYLEPLLLLGLFGKKPLSITLRGITNHVLDPSVDTFKSVTIPFLKSVGIEGVDLKVVKRGAAPGGGGEVVLTVPIVKSLPAVRATEEGMVRRVRGIAHAMRVTPQAANRCVDGARGVLNDFLADVYIFTDHMTGAKAGASPGYGVTLVAETTAGRLVSAEVVADAPGRGKELTESGRVPEDIGARAARALLEEVARGGVVDTSHQGLAVLLAALGPEEIAELRFGPLTAYAVQTLRHVREVFGVRFTIRPEEKTSTVFLSCVGCALKNTARSTI
ncbi:unnamed protein product [Pedinophyceae sp. YPF-701]|nr:unnamed protein product [Pedinophyceae sp. YPF-701]